METVIALSSDHMTCRLQQSLDAALPEFYAVVLVFSVKARQYCDPSNTGKHPFNGFFFFLQSTSGHRENPPMVIYQDPV